MKDSIETREWPMPARRPWPFLSTQHGPAANDAEDYLLCRWLAIVGKPGDPTHQRVVIGPCTDDEAMEQSDLLHQLADSLGVGFKLRPVTCKDDEHDERRADEHDIYFVGGRDPDAKVAHYACRWCARRELNESDFAS